MKTIVAYVSAHGFGHWAQISPVLDALYRIDPDVHIVLRTNLSKAVLDARSAFPFKLMPGQVDVGVIQRDALNEDIPATVKAVEQFHRNWDERVWREANLLRDTGADLVISDIAPLAFAAAASAGIPSIGLASIDWHAIYTPLFPAHHASLEQIEAAHRDCNLLLALPLCMPMPSFPRQRKIGLIARKSGATRHELRQRLGYADDDRLALVMFGGSSMPPFRVEALARMTNWRFIMPSLPAGDMPANVQAMPEGWNIPDLIRASDVIVCKPGYGIVSEAWLEAIPIVYVSRPAFPEYPYLQDWLVANAPSCELDREAFAGGDWAKALETATGSDQTYPSCHANGETEAAGIIRSALAGEGLATMGM
jgi:UDP:flavonoid glycosyltransferase YjiC (YdhE family)